MLKNKTCYCSNIRAQTRRNPAWGYSNYTEVFCRLCSRQLVGGGGGGEGLFNFMVLVLITFIPACFFFFIFRSVIPVVCIAPVQRTIVKYRLLTWLPGQVFFSVITVNHPLHKWRHIYLNFVIDTPIQKIRPRCELMTRRREDIHPSRPKLSLGERTFRYSGAILFNSLPESYKRAASLEAFKRLLMKHDFA